jgi:CBS-domain-containing membrane protein
MRILDRNIRTKFPQYAFQCGLATVAMFLILLVQDTVLRAAIIVAIASSAFIIFVVPESVAATSRKVIGGHLVAVLVATPIAAVLNISVIEAAAEDSRYVADIAAAVSVGLSILVMVMTDTEHPPAAGTALGLIIPGWSWSAVIFIMSGAIILTLIRIVLRRKLINLL